MINLKIKKIINKKVISYNKQFKNFNKISNKLAAIMNKKTISYKKKTRTYNKAFKNFKTNFNQHKMKKTKLFNIIKNYKIKQKFPHNLIYKIVKQAKIKWIHFFPLKQQIN